MKITKKSILLLALIFITNLASAASHQAPPLADKVFLLSGKLAQPNKIILHWKIKGDAYLYRSNFSFKIATPKHAKLSTIKLPLGQWKTDNIWGKHQIYTKQVTIEVPIIGVSNNNVTLLATYQGCSEDGYCYSPTTHKVFANFAANTLSTDFVTSLTPLQHIKELFTQGNFLVIVLSFLGFGLLLAFTPCVLPMIPILTSLIAGQENLNTSKAFWLSFTYVLSMALTYAIAGIIVSLAGSNIQALMQNSVVLAVFSLLFVLLALSLFGLYELRMPQFVQERLTNLSGKQATGSFAGVAMMGILATLIVSPCVTPPLIGALAYIGKSGNIILGGSALFALGLGMGIPLLIAGTLGGKFLPKAGAWMVGVQKFFGIIMLGVAVWLIERILPGSIVLALYSTLLLITAFIMGIHVWKKQNKPQKIFKIPAILLAIYAALLLIGAIQGHTDPLAPLAKPPKLINGVDPISGLHFINVHNVAEVKRALIEAKVNHKLVMLDFYAKWCVSCNEMEYTVFRNLHVKQLLSHFILLKADVTKSTKQVKNIEDYFNVVAPPTFVFFNRQGHILKGYQLVGSMTATAFSKYLANLLTKGN